MKYSAIFIFLLFFLVGCVKPDVQSVYNLTFNKRYDLNQNKVLEEDEYKRILIREYKTLKFFKKLSSKHMNVDQYVETEFIGHDFNNDKIVTWEEKVRYGRLKSFDFLDLNKNGVLELNDEFRNDFLRNIYDYAVNIKDSSVKSSTNNFITFDEFITNSKLLINPNNDDKIELNEYLNYLDNNCLFNSFKP